MKDTLVSGHIDFEKCLGYKGAMNIEDLDYFLPPTSIAAYPAEPRDSSRLMILNRNSGRFEHRKFNEVAALLRPEDVLVLNDTRVFPARVVGHKANTGGHVELLLMEQLKETGQEGSAADNRPRGPLWRTLLASSKRVRAGLELEFDGDMNARVISLDGNGTVIVEFSGAPPFREWLEEVGQTPLPPYIRREVEPEDRQRYQTVYAEEEGSMAAPTAGMHFTPELMRQIRDRGVALATLTLHIGPGTFRPVRTEQVADHLMSTEKYHLSPTMRKTISDARKAGGRVIAVGTSCVRALEDDALKQSESNGFQSAELFILPGHEFKVIDGMITNYHLPRSTNLSLVMAFAGQRNTLKAYQEAVAQGYRFYSYGDALWIS